MGYNCKVCIVGEMAVGKTSLASRYTTGNHSRAYRPNCNAHHFSTSSVEIDGEHRMFIWDTAGCERFRSMIHTYLRGAHCCMLTFSLTDKKSFHAVEDFWVSSVRNWAPSAKCVLVANKADVDEEERVVSIQEINKFCNLHKMKYFETSAVIGLNVIEVFSYAARVAAKQREKDSFFDSFQLYEIPDPVKKKNPCCV